MSEKQKAARARNWEVRQLRGFHSAVRRSCFTADEQAAITTTIDKALARLGAETEADRRERYRAELEAAYQAKGGASC